MNWLFQTFNLITLEHIALNKYLQLKRGKNLLTIAKKTYILNIINYVCKLSRMTVFVSSITKSITPNSVY